MLHDDDDVRRVWKWLIVRWHPDKIIGQLWKRENRVALCSDYALPLANILLCSFELDSTS